VAGPTNQHRGGPCCGGRRVATWAAGLCAVEGPGGTRVWLEPVVLQRTLAEVDALLAPGRAELALFAAWAVHDQRGPRAKAVVERAVVTVLAVEDAELRKELIRATPSMLGEHLAKIVKEMLMKPLVLPDVPIYNEIVAELRARAQAALEAEFEARGEARGEAKALLRLLATRDVAVDEEAHARITECRDVALLDRWFDRAVTATSVAAVLTDN